MQTDGHTNTEKLMLPPHIAERTRLDSTTNDSPNIHGRMYPSTHRDHTARLSASSTPALGSTQPPNQWIPGAFSPGGKRPGREAGHSPPASAEVKKMWIYTSTLPYAFMA
jgi:hypothetical protein